MFNFSAKQEVANYKQERRQQTITMGHIWPTSSFFMALELRMFFTFLNGWGEEIKIIIFYDI